MSESDTCESEDEITVPYRRFAARVARDFVPASLLKMASMHLEYPREQGFFRWDELQCLSKALGFPGDLFERHFPEDIQEKYADGFKLEELEELINIYRYLHLPLDRSFNNHTDDWNINVLHKALMIVTYRCLSFAELKGVRMAYQTFESQDTKGMTVNQKQLVRAIQLCERMIAPKKLMHRLKHMKNNLEEKNRVQLHEFLDLLLWCDQYEHMDMDQPKLKAEKNHRVLYKMDSFTSLLTHHDQRLHARLNNEFQTDEFTFTREKHASKSLPAEVSIDPNIRENMAKLQREGYRPLRNKVSQSQQQVQHARAGHIREDTECTRLQTTASEEPRRPATAGSVDSRPQSVMDMCEWLIRPKSAQSSRSDIRDEIPRPEVRRYRWHKVPDAVTDQDKKAAVDSGYRLLFDVETVETRYNILMKEDMDYLIPNYWQRMESLKNQEPPRAAPRRVRSAPRPTTETLKHLAYPAERGPSPSHARSCDARFRGWHKVQTQPGHHTILSSPYNEQSVNGKLLSKIHERNIQQLQGLRTDVIHRRATQQQGGKKRPRTAPHRLRRRKSSSCKMEDSSQDNQPHDGDQPMTDQEEKIDSQVAEATSSEGGDSTAHISEKLPVKVRSKPVFNYGCIDIRNSPRTDLLKMKTLDLKL